MTYLSRKYQAGFPPCIALSIEFNEHAVYYDSASKWIEDQESQDSQLEWVSVEERQRAIETDSVWVCHWYPTTPIGSYTLAASSFETLMAAVLKVES